MTGNETIPTTFDSFISCMNQTSGCHGHGSCLLNGDKWTCQCALLFLPSDSCGSFFSVLFDKSMYLWCLFLIVYGVLAALVITEIALNLKERGKSKNAMMVTKLLLLLYILFRIGESTLWILSVLSKGTCARCVSALHFFLLFPFVLGILVFTICVVVWYSLILGFAMKQNLYVFGRNLYIAMAVIYSVGSVILLFMILLSFETFLQILVYWTIVPLVLLIVHSLYQVLNLHFELKSRAADRAIKKAQQKNTSLGVVSIIYIFLIVLSVIQLYYGNRLYLNYMIWLLLYGLIRVIEMVILILFYRFSEKYTTLFIYGKRNSSSYSASRTHTKQSDITNRPSQKPDQ